MQPLDLFPHTNHYMSVFLLVRVTQADLLYPHRANMNTYYGMLPFTPDDMEVEQEAETAPPPPGDDQQLLAGLSGEQQAWLSQMSAQYGPSFDREKWIQSMLEQNREAAMRQQQHQVAMVPAPRPPSPQIPPMPPFPVAPTSSV